VRTKGERGKGEGGEGRETWREREGGSFFLLLLGLFFGHIALKRAQRARFLGILNSSVRSGLDFWEY
jgi:hypothetical protein